MVSRDDDSPVPTGLPKAAITAASFPKNSFHAPKSCSVLNSPGHHSKHEVVGHRACVMVSFFYEFPGQLREVLSFSFHHHLIYLSTQTAPLSIHNSFKRLTVIPPMPWLLHVRTPRHRHGSWTGLLMTSMHPIMWGLLLFSHQTDARAWS